MACLLSHFLLLHLFFQLNLLYYLDMIHPQPHQLHLSLSLLNHCPPPYPFTFTFLFFFFFYCFTKSKSPNNCFNIEWANSYIIIILIKKIQNFNRIEYTTYIISVSNLIYFLIEKILPISYNGYNII